MDIVDALAVGLLAASGATASVSLALLPRVWREYRWTRQYGDEFERAVGIAVWCTHLAAIGAATTFAIAGARIGVISGDEHNRALVLISLVTALACCVLLLVAQVAYTRHRAPDVERHLYVVRHDHLHRPQSGSGNS